MGDNSLNGMVREEMQHEVDEKHHPQHEDHEGHHFKNGMDEHQGVGGEDGDEYESAHRGEQEQDDFGNYFLFSYFKSILSSFFLHFSVK